MRRYFVIIPLLIIGLLVVFTGCERDIKGPERINIKPVVNFVNIPVADALFSSDTTLYWYGTDVDGFIDSFYYTVVRLADVGSDPDAFLAGGGLQTDDMSDGWTGIKVELDNTGTNARIQMSADISDPVRIYVTSYVFLMAVDNKGDRSDIVYRSFAKNNHFPNTSIDVQGYRDPYINATSERQGILEGLTVNFRGEDRIDYPRNPPPFEYRWKVFGPFNDSLKDVIDTTYITETFVDLYGDFFQHGDTLRYFSRLDTTIVGPDTTIDTIWNEFPVNVMLGGNPYGFWQEAMLGIDPKMDSLALDSSEYGRLTNLSSLNSYVVDSSDNWTYNTRITVYDLFEKENLPSVDADTTRIMTFLVWCQTRDDAHVPDPVPEFRFVTAIEPKFERDVVIIDAGIYDRANVHNWPIFPRSPWRIPEYPNFPDTSGPVVRNVLGEFINNWNPDSFDMTNLLPDDTICPDATPDCGAYFLHVARKWRNGTTQDYYPVKAIDPYRDSGYGSISLREILKHKIALIIKDNTSSTIGFQTLEGLALVEGINSGMNAWIMARAAEGEGFITENNRLAAGEILSSYFGVNGFQQSGWQERTATGDVRIEDFIGATSLISDELPDLFVDTTRLETFYLWDSDSCLTNPEFPCYPFRDLNTDTIIAGAIPEVGFIIRGFGTEPLYLYKSKYGSNPPFYINRREGTVVAIRYANNYFRTSHFNFNVMAMDEVSAKQVFETMMEWLSYQPFINAGKVNANYFGSDVQKYRNISNHLHELKKQGLLPSMSELQ